MSLTRPSAYALEKAISIAQQTVAGLDADGVDTDENELRVILRDGGADVEHLLLRVLRAADEAEADIDGITARIAALTVRKERRVRARKVLRGLAVQIIEALPAVFPGGKYKGPEISASIRAGVARAIVVEQAIVPDEYWRITRALDMQALNTAIREHPIAGCHRSNPEPSLTVRTK